MKILDFLPVLALVLWAVQVLKDILKDNEFQRVIDARLDVYTNKNRGV